MCFVFFLWLLLFFSHVQLFATPMDCSTPGFPVLHYLLEFAQTRVHWVDDAIVFGVVHYQCKESIRRFKTDGLICLVFVYCWFWYSYMALIFPLSFMIFDWELLIIFQLNVIYFQIWFQSWAPLEITCGLFFCYFLACRQPKKFQYMYFFFFCLLDLCLCDPNRGTNF